VKKFIVGFIAFLFFIGAPFATFAKEAKTKIIYKKKTIIDFEDNVVKGELVKPKGAYYQSRGRAKFNSMIMYRKSFIKKMMKDAKKI